MGGKAQTSRNEIMRSETQHLCVFKPDEPVEKPGGAPLVLLERYLSILGRIADALLLHCRHALAICIETHPPDLPYQLQNGDGADHHNAPMDRKVDRV